MKPPSSLFGITLQIPVQSVKAVRPGIAGIISMTLSQERQYPQLKNVDMQFTSGGAGSGEESDSGHREEVELAMHALKARGVLRLLWE
jgi:hypothetical protein